MSCPSWQWHRTGSSWSPVRTLPVAPLWCDLGFVPNGRGNKAAANLSPMYLFVLICTDLYWMYGVYGNVCTGLYLYVLYLVCIDIFATIDWYHYIIHAKYLHYAYQYIPGYMAILVHWAKTCVLNLSCIGTWYALVCIGMYLVCNGVY